MTRVPFVDLRGQFTALEDDITRAIDEVLRSTAFVMGEAVGQFEVEFARFCGARFGIGVANGTDALLLTLKAFGVGPGDEVITPANTFVATVEAIVHAGATPVLVDVDPDTYTLATEQMRNLLTPRVKAIIPVHLYGHPAEMDPLLEMARAHGCVVIEDASQAHGAEYRGRRVGSLADAACFSFYPSKNLGAYGDGGAIITNREDIAERTRELRNHGSHRRDEHHTVGYNSRLDTVQAAVLRVKLPHLVEWNRKRQQHARRYAAHLQGIPGLTLPITRPGCSHAFHLYVVRVEDGSRDALREDLRARGVDARVHYPTPVHLTPAFRYLGYGPGAFPVSERNAGQVLSLPIYPELSEEQVAFVASAVAGAVRSAAGVRERGA